jgi:hypothetical protein
MKPADKPTRIGLGQKTEVVRSFSGIWIGQKHGFPPPSRASEELNWRIIRNGTEHDATLVEFVTSDGFFVGVLLPGGMSCVEGDLFLVETMSDLLLARVERNYAVRYTCRLVRLRESFREGGWEYRWVHQDGLLTGKQGPFRVVRHAPLRVKTKREALATFEAIEPRTLEDVGGWEVRLDCAGRDLEIAKWLLQKDMHGQVIRALEKLDESKEANPRLLDEAGRQFAIDVMARTGLQLHPIEQLTPTQRKSLARRGRKARNLAVRQFFLKYHSHGYNKLYAKELAREFFRTTGEKKSPAALTKVRERLGLTTKAAGRPSSYGKS